MKPLPWKCGTCRERAVVSATFPSYSVELEHDGRKYHVTVENLEAFACEKCGAVVLDDAANRRLSAALRSAAGLLQPIEIRDQREALGLTQKDLAHFMNLSEFTLSRWETGAQIQQRCMDQFLRGFFAVEEFRRFLGVSNRTAGVPEIQPETLASV